jgi:hypothetical protein
LWCASSFGASVGVRFLGDGPLAGAASTDGWRLAPNDVAGLVPQSHWNQIETVDGGDHPDLDQGSSGVLRDDRGMATAIELRYAGNDAWNTMRAVSTPDEKLMKGLLKRFGPEPMTLTFSNLSAGTYDVYLYGAADAGPVNLDVRAGSEVIYWTEAVGFSGLYIEGASGDSDSRAEGNYVKFAGVSPIKGAITITASYRGGGYGLGIAALQLVSPVAFPEFQPPTSGGVATEVRDLTVYEGTAAKWTFVATNNAVPNILTAACRWYKNGTLMAGVTGSQFAFVAGASDNHALVCAVADYPAEFNPHAVSVRSATGIVTVLPSVICTNGLKVEFFPGATRQAIEAGSVLTTNLSVTSTFDLPVNSFVENYSRRVSGYFVPPASGRYVFFVCADDDADLFLSTDGDPAHKRLIAQEESWSSPWQWVSSSGWSKVSQKRSDQWSPDQGLSTPYGEGIPLVAGRGYYLEGVHHQGRGGDNFSVTYKLIADPDPTDDDMPKLQAADGNIALLTRPSTVLTWLAQPQDLRVEAGQPAVFTALAVTDSEFPTAYQWYRDGKAVPNATSRSFEITTAAADDNSVWHVVASTAVGGLSLTSSAATLRVGGVPRVQPELTVKTSGFGQLMISWTGTGTLEQSDSLTGLNWHPAQNQSNPQSVPIGPGVRFYRVRQ